MQSKTRFINELTGGDLSTYLRQIRHYPMLEVDDEFACIKRWQKRNDTAALRRLVTSHLRLVVKTAHGYRRYGLPLEDLVSEGSVGLIQAIDRFNSAKGFRLATYAKWWIRAAMQEYIMRSWSLVRIGTTVGQKKLFFNLRRLKLDLSDGDARQLSDEDIEIISDRLNVSAHEVVSMESRMSNADLSLNETVADEDASEWQDRLVDDRDNQETLYADAEELAYQRTLLHKALAELPAREREIFIKRRIEEDRSTLGELGEMFKISPERVRQIEHGVFMKLRESLQNNHLEHGYA